MDVIIWAIILGAVFYINKNQRAQAAKHAAKQTETAAEDRYSRYGTACRIQFSRV